MTHESSSSQMHTFWHDHECACCIDTDCIACCIDTDCIACCIDTDCIACCMAMHAMFERACMHAPCSSFPKVTKVSAAPFVAQAHTTIAITHVAIMCAPHRLFITVHIIDMLYQRHCATGWSRQRMQRVRGDQHAIHVQPLDRGHRALHGLHAFTRARVHSPLRTRPGRTHELETCNRAPRDARAVERVS
jgi:hypothetical protein